MLLQKRTIDFIWLLLMAMTLGSAAIAESAEPGLGVAVAIAVIIGAKGIFVVDRFMELHNANRHIRAWMRAYFYVVPLLIVLVYLYPETVARMTTL